MFNNGCALCALLLLSPMMASAEIVTIGNKTLTVSYDTATGSFAIAEREGGKAFLTNGRLEGTSVRASVEAVDDGVFGVGKKVVITQTDGSIALLELYDKLPFALIRTERRNAGKETLEVRKAIPAVFMLDLGKPANELRTMGTGGLLAPDANPGSYLFLTCADPVTRRGVVAGWITEDRGSGVLFSAIKQRKVEFKAQIDYGHLRIPAGESARLETLAIGIFDDARLGEEQFADAIAKHYQIKLRPQVAGYCTWYSDQHGGAGDENSIVELAKVAAKGLKPFGFSFVQIDDEWQDGGTYNGPRRGFDRVKADGSYPHGMRAVAEQFDNLGLTAGIWFLPFARNHQDPEYADRQHWFVNRDNGKPYETVWGGTSLDLTHPEVKAHLVQLVKTIRSWGYNYFKMDGLWTGTATDQIYVNDGYKDDHIGNNAPLHDPAKTNIEAFRDGLKLLRQAAGPDVFFSGCNVSQNMRSLGGSLGLVDSMRVGPDNGPDWDDMTIGPIRGSRLYFLHGRVWWNDPDPSYVRASIPLNHAQVLPTWVAISGTFNLNSDWIPGLPKERLDIMKRTMPAHGVTARPVDYFDSALPTAWLVTDDKQNVRRDVIGLFNWNTSVLKANYTCWKLGLDPTKAYHAFDFWAKRPFSSFQGQFKCEVPPQSCRVIAVRADEGHPLLVSTSRHVCQGIGDVLREQWDAASSTLSGTSAVVEHDPYELRIAGLAAGNRQWKMASVTLSPADQAAGVTITPMPVAEGEEGWLRVLINSKTSRAVSWTMHF